MSALMRQAFQDIGCTRPTPHVPAEADPPADATAHLPALWGAVARAADGRASSVTGIPLTAPVPRLLGVVRRRFLELARSTQDALEVHDVLRFLGALEDVQAAHGRESSGGFVGQLGGPRGLDLVVEVAHDMRSPLTSILFLVETLRRGQSGGVTKMQERQLGLVYSAAFGLSALASDVIELAKGGTRLVESQPVPFSVGEILESVRDIVQPMAEEKGLTMNFVHPDPDGRVGHPAALSRVLLNLTTNALKFTSAGAVTVVARAEGGRQVHFSVSDTGRGIPDSVLGSLFDAFRRAESGSYAFSSAGLGLSICRKLVTAMGGRLEVETRPDEGARFCFTLDLPIASSSRAASERAASERAASEPSSRVEHADEARSQVRASALPESRGDVARGPRTDSRRADSR